MEVPEGINATNSPTTDSDTESLELMQVYSSAVTNRGPLASMQRPHRPVFDRSANGTVVSPVESTTSQPVRVPALVPNIRVSNFGVGLVNQTAIAKPTVTDSGFVREDREPRDLKQALQYSLSLCDGNSSVTEVSEERKTILKEVMDNCFKTTSVLRQRLQYLSNEELYKTENCEETVIECLEAIEMEVELTDQANDFCKQNGMEILSRFFFCNNAEVRIVALNVFATVVQNNPVGMHEALQKGILTGLMDDLTNIVSSKTPLPDAVAIKSLYAISCLLRGNHEGCNLFKKKCGFRNTLRILSLSENPKILKKCYYIIVSLVADEVENGGIDVPSGDFEEWKNHFEVIVDRFIGMEPVDIAVSLAQVLDEMISHYKSHPKYKPFQMLYQLKVKDLSLALENYLKGIDDKSLLDLSQDEVQLMKTCQALKKHCVSLN